jgi:hypothetical protein
MPLPDVSARLAVVVQRLANLDIDSDIDPGKVSLPGVWVHWTGLDHPVNLNGDGYVAVDLVLMVPANELSVAIPALQAIAEEVVEEFGSPDGDSRTQSTTLPDGGAPVPSLVLPYLVA